MLKRGQKFIKGKYTYIAFDGGSRAVNSKAGHGAAGYVIADAGGNELIRVGLYLGKGKTNNESEAQALCSALQHVHQLRL